MESYDVLRALSLVIVWAIPAILIMGVIAFTIASPVLILGGGVIRLYEAVGIRLQRLYEATVVRLRRRTQVEMHGLNLSCSIDTDCPPGYVCLGGRCVLQKT